MPGLHVPGRYPDWRLTTVITDTHRLTPTKRAELRGRISTMPGLNRFLRVTGSSYPVAVSQTPG
jgi:hypothetical protein